MLSFNSMQLMKCYNPEKRAAQH